MQMASKVTATLGGFSIVVGAALQLFGQSRGFEWARSNYPQEWARWHDPLALGLSALGVLLLGPIVVDLWKHGSSKQSAPPSSGAATNTAGPSANTSGPQSPIAGRDVIQHIYSQPIPQQSPSPQRQRELEILPKVWLMLNELHGYSAAAVGITWINNVAFDRMSNVVVERELTKVGFLPEQIDELLTKKTQEEKFTFYVDTFHRNAHNRAEAKQRELMNFIVESRVFLPTELDVKLTELCRNIGVALTQWAFDKRSRNETRQHEHMSVILDAGDRLKEVLGLIKARIGYDPAESVAQLTANVPSLKATPPTEGLPLPIAQTESQSQPLTTISEILDAMSRASDDQILVAFKNHSGGILVCVKQNFDPDQGLPVSVSLGDIRAVIDGVPTATPAFHRGSSFIATGGKLELGTAHKQAFFRQDTCWWLVTATGSEPFVKWSLENRQSNSKKLTNGEWAMTVRVEVGTLHVERAVRIIVDGNAVEVKG